MMQNRPFKTPIVALAVHLGVTILFICAPPAGDAFNFIVSLSSYPTTFLLTAITVGLVKLRLTKDEGWASAFTAPWAMIAFYLVGNIVSSPPYHRSSKFQITFLTVQSSCSSCLSSHRQMEKEALIFRTG